MYERQPDIKPFAPLADPVSDIGQQCNQCGSCQSECPFLKSHGTPKQLADRFRLNPEKTGPIAFECSLCGLCTAVCPKKLDAGALFLRMRQHAVSTDKSILKKYQGLIKYEARGTSRQFSFYSLPEDCDTVFFPGCSLPGTRPETTLKTYRYLRKKNPRIGIVLDCCTKPSHDLGRTDHFHAMFNPLKLYLLEHQIRTIIVACPNCHKIFTSHGQEFEVKTVYDIMSEDENPCKIPVKSSVALHDPCPVRFDTQIHTAVRKMISSRGLSLLEPAHHGSKTLCCGEGGAVGCLSKAMALHWRDKRADETGPHPIATYCAGCVHMLSKKSPAFHVLDLVWDPKQTLAGKAKVAKAPFTYLNRLILKKKLKQLPAKTFRERPERPSKKSRVLRLARWGALAGVISVMAGIFLR